MVSYSCGLDIDRLSSMRRRQHGELGDSVATSQSGLAVRLPVWLLVLGRLLEERCRDEHATTAALRQLAQPGGFVHGIADHGVFVSLGGSDVAGDDEPC